MMDVVAVRSRTHRAKQRLYWETQESEVKCTTQSIVDTNV